MSLPNGSSLDGRLHDQGNAPATLTQGVELTDSPTSLRDAVILPGHTGATAVGDTGKESGSDAGEQSDADESEESDEEEDSEVVHESAGRPRAAQLEGYPTQLTDGHTDDGDMEDDDSNEEEEDSDDDDDEEPALKYERLGGPVNDLLQKDSASSLTIANKLMAMGTHAGIVHVLDLSGNRIKSYKPHSASILDICMDATADFIATASIDGQIVIYSLSTTENFVFDMKRPMRTVALEPDFAKRGTRAFICGGTAGTLVMHEKGWLGHKETMLHQGEGPIYQVRWRARLIAWANDVGVKIYDTVSQTRITFIDRPPNSPRADLFKCTLHWQDDLTLIISWADHIKVARVRARPRTSGANAASLPPLIVEITAVFQLDCMISGIVPHPTPPASVSLSAAAAPGPASATVLTSFLVLAYTPPDASLLEGEEATDDRAKQARKAAERPELRIVSRGGEELAADALGVAGFQAWGCNDYVLVSVDEEAADAPIASGPSGRCYVVMSPKDVIVVRPRDRRDHVAWLVERKRYEEALEEVQTMGEHDRHADVDIVQIGQRYIEHLVGEGDFAKAAHLCPKVCAQEAKRWEDWIFVFAQKHQLQTIIPYIPTDSPRLSRLVYEMILAHFLSHDLTALLHTVREWPREIYDISAVIIAVQSELDRSSIASPSGKAKPNVTILMECLAELYTANRQPGKALPFFIRLRRPNVFDLIRENNLFTEVQDQALLLIEFDHELMEKRRQEGEEVDESKGTAITLLVDHIYSIPVGRVVQQLQSRPYYLFLYLDALFLKDPHNTSNFADQQVQLYAEYAPTRLIDFLRASNYYSLERAYTVCKERDLVPEMVFLLGRMGNNRQALTLIIERLGDVNRAIDFAKEQRDNELWEDLLRYSETRPAFIRGLLENVGPEIDPIRLIRRIKNGLEIPGLKEALIKILHDFNLQISLLEGCQTILDGDCSDLARRVQRDQSSGFFLTGKAKCKICSLPLQRAPQSLVLLFLCRHAVHASCVPGGDTIPYQADTLLAGLDAGEGAYVRALGAKIAFTAVVRSRITTGCPVCHRRAEGERT